ncbi:MAG: ABC transporter permease [Muribaculaceae bacterium]|nr:ABC transporter permease [Muribaculaceae bacterium]
MIDLFREIGQTLTNNKMRTFLTGIAVVWGIFMLIVLLGLSSGVAKAFQNQVHKQGSNQLKIWGGQTTEPWHGYKKGRAITLKESDLARIAAENCEQVAGVSAQISSPAITISTDFDYIMSSFLGVFPSELGSRGIKMGHGRFINDLDMKEKRKVAVLSTQTAESLFADPKKATGKTVRAGDVVFTVIGIYESRWDRGFYIPYSTARILLGGGDSVDNISVELKNVSSEADGMEAENRTRRSLASQHDFSPTDSGAVDFWNQFNQKMQMNTAQNILSISVWVIGMFTLLSGIIGVSNIMFVSVRERTHEIGVRRAIGAKPRSILTQIICESIAITTIFGYIGIFLGSAVNEVIARLTENSEGISNPRTDLSIALSVTAVLILAGIAAGLFPALKALKIKPVEALREE